MVEAIKVAGFIKTSAVDGPGIRSVLFFQGCSRNCPDCHNKDISNKNGGINVTIKDVVQYIKKNCKNKKLTISGGEPLEQLAGLYELLKELKEEGFDLCLYTGFDRNNVPEFITECLHYLKSGRFVKEMMYPTKAFVGSYNQKFVKICDRIDEED